MCKDISGRAILQCIKPKAVGHKEARTNSVHSLPYTPSDESVNHLRFLVTLQLKVEVGEEASNIITNTQRHFFNREGVT